MKYSKLSEQGMAQGYIALVFFSMFLYGISRQAMGTLITPIIGHYGITMAQAGLLSSFFSAGVFSAIFVITIFVGRINKLILMGSSLFLYTISLCLISAAPQFAVLLLCFALIGIFGATADTLSNSLIADLRPDSISRNISLLHGIYGLGGLCGPIAIERLSVALSWTQVYFTISLAFLVFLIIYTVFVKWQWSRLTIKISHRKQARFGFSDIIQFFALKRNILLWLSIFFYSGNQNTMGLWIKRYVETDLNTALWGAYALSAMWLGISVSRLFISPNIKATSLRKICIGNIISTIALIIGLVSGSAKGVAAASLVVGLSSGFTIPLILATCCEWYPDKTALGTLMPYTALSVASVVFPPLSGLINDFLGISWGIALFSVSGTLLTAVLSRVLETKLKTENTRN